MKTIYADAVNLINEIFDNIKKQISKGTKDPVLIFGTGFNFNDKNELYIGYNNTNDVFFIGCKADDLKGLKSRETYTKHIWMQVHTLKTSTLAFSKLAAIEFDNVIEEAQLKFLFALVISNLIELGEPTERTDLFIVINELKEIFKSYTDKAGISPKERAAIYAELYTLHRLMVYAKKNAKPTKTVLNYWYGPDHDEHDFYNDEDAIEVKSITGKYDIVTIHGEYQLTKPDTGELYLLAYRLKEEKKIGKSMEKLILEIKEMLDPSDYDDLAFTLAKLKISLDDLDQYKEWKFNPEKEFFYLIDKTFPKINEDLIKNIENSKAIRNVQYQIFLNDLNRDPMKSLKLEAILEKFAIK